MLQKISAFGIMLCRGDFVAQADEIFIQNCKDILKKGDWDKGKGAVRPRWQDGEPAYSIGLFGLINRYDLSKEFPALTLRRLAFKTCVDEILWIWQKKSNKLSELKGKIWNQWAGEDGTIGKAYGYQLAKKHRYTEGEFDQVDRALYDLTHNKSSRRIITNMYNHEELYAMNLYPCAYSMTFNVKHGRLNAILNQRSQDFLVANNWNVCQYAVLLHIFAQSCGLEPGELVHVIADAHIYDRHVDLVEQLIKKEPKAPARLWINPEKSDFYSFNVSDFKLLEYEYHDFDVAIPVAE